MFCPNCKKEIQNNVQFCPECGTAVTMQAPPVANIKKQKKPITKKWWFWVIIIIAVIALICSVSGGSDNISDSTNNDSISQQDTANNTTSAQETTTVKTTFTVGDSVNDGNLKITYSSAEEWKGYSQYSEPEDGNKIIRVKFDFANDGDTDVYINSFYCYADNQAAKDYYSGDGTLTTWTLSSGRTTSAYFYYEAPADAEEIEIEYEVNMWSDKKAIFNVDL